MGKVTATGGHNTGKAGFTTQGSEKRMQPKKKKVTDPNPKGWLQPEAGRKKYPVRRNNATSGQQCATGGARGAALRSKSAPPRPSLLQIYNNSPPAPPSPQIYATVARGQLRPLRPKATTPLRQDRWLKPRLETPLVPHRCTTVTPPSSLLSGTVAEEPRAELGLCLTEAFREMTAHRSRSRSDDVQLHRFNSVSALPCLSDSSSDEDSVHTHNNTNRLLEVDTYKVCELLNKLRREPTVAISLFTQLKEQGFRHDVSTYMAFIRILCQFGMDRRLDSVLLEVINAKERELGFDISDLFDRLAEGLKSGGLHSLTRALDALIKVYASNGMFDQAIDTLFQTKRRGFVPHIFTCNFLMNRAIESGKSEMSVAIYKQLKRLGLNPNVYTYAIVVKVLCRQGNLEEAVDVLCEMEEAGVTPDGFTYSTYVEGLCLHGRADLGYELLCQWRAAKVPISVFSYSAVIRGFVNDRMLEKAEGILVDMEEVGPIHTVILP
ncbi:hypothetical protein RJ639_039783 [Escallonia herrerae]|uniref:Pentatricopeptide repeat-containing protein n=1 Tax=Escallonia herrerae TaxID=1293975 RepID=A0AA89B801_9ASTE|nr:hypothetical protein RJ639_039783 [Escallonia herrerae]